MARSPKEIVWEVLPRAMARELWSGNYRRALPISVQDFEISAVLPAVFYMFRFGYRRGRGKFLETFGKGATPAERRRSATVGSVAALLSGREDMVGFETDTGRAILGDLLLCYGLENKRHALGRDQQVQRVAPVHYLTSWIDLPANVANLRFVPEMIVAMLANQQGDTVTPTEDEKTRFPVARRHEENPLLRAFGQAVEWPPQIANHAGDRFDEANLGVGIDQLLMIRVAQHLGRAPDKMRAEGSRISNQRPIAVRAARHFSEDLRRFVRSWAPVIPRRSFVDLLESSMAVGMTTIMTSVAGMLFRWEADGVLPGKPDQAPVELLADCSNGVDWGLRRLSEASLDDFVRRMEQLPRMLMHLRILDYQASNNRSLKKENIETGPDATKWINLLGALSHSDHYEAAFVHRTVEGYAEDLSEALKKGGHTKAAKILGDAQSEPNPVRRFASGLTELVGSRLHENNLKMMDSMLGTGRPTGLSRSRRGKGQTSGTGRRTRTVRSLVLADSVLEYLVHLDLLPKGPGLRRRSFEKFLRVLRKRYGFCVDRAPRGMAVSNDLLQKNRACLERRLRDLGLLRGVNDAEAMKRLQPRFLEPAA